MKNMALVLLVFCCALFAQDNVAVAIRGVELLRGRVRDPDSLVVERIYVNAKSAKSPMCIRYRARNGFGGYVRGWAEYKGADKLETEPIFSHCPGLDMDVDTAIKDYAIKKGWVDITDEYRKAASTAPSDTK